MGKGKQIDEGGWQPWSRAVSSPWTPSNVICNKILSQVGRRQDGRSSY